jgi:hypothetical protein
MREMENRMIWRHGDVLIAASEGIPAGAQRRHGVVVAYGEITGHSHRFQEANAVELWEHDGILFVNILAATATIVHEEHRPISLSHGVYRVWMQREYTPQAIRRVAD